MADLTIKDARNLMAEIVKQATGQKDIAILSTNDFISAGEKVLRTGMENVFNSINIVLGKTMIAARPYNGKLVKMDSENTGMFTNLLREISFYSKFPKHSGFFNTDLYTNLKDGYTAGQNIDAEGAAHSTKSQWEQNQAMPLELNFAGSSAWDNCITLYESQVKEAFRNEGEFNSFVAGYLTEHNNDIQQQKEAYRRMCLINTIASTIDMKSVMPESCVNLTAEFNAKYDTNYTTHELLTDYYKELMAFFVADVKKKMERLTERSANYHWSVPKVVDGETYHILRHTPKDRQRMYLYSDFINDAKALVFPEIFNDKYLKLEQYEEVTFWQSDKDGDRSKINVTPAVVNTTTGVQESGANVSLDYVVGMICDDEAVKTNFMLDTTYTTPVEARKGYRNTWQHMKKGNIMNPTKSRIIYYMSDSE